MYNVLCTIYYIIIKCMMFNVLSIMYYVIMHYQLCLMHNVKSYPNAYTAT